MPGVQGRVLAVLAEATGELNLRTIARLAGVSPAQASRVLPGLVELGVVERREVPPSSLFRLECEHVAARALLLLARSTETVLAEIGGRAAELPIPPQGVIVFGSLARGDAGVDSDVDVAVIRPSGIDEDDEDWVASIEEWRRGIRRLTGNAVEVLEVGAEDLGGKLHDPLWQDICRYGRVVYGSALDDAVMCRG